MKKPKEQSNLVSVDDPIRSMGMANKLTDATIKEMLKGGTPDWFKRPEEYKNFAREEYLAQKEISCNLSSEYHMEDQELLSDEGPRRVNVLPTYKFLRMLKDNGIHVGATEIQGEPQLAGLWAICKTPEGKKPVCIGAIQIPAMYEWSILRLDEWGVSQGEKFIGWRTALCSLITKGALTEQKAHEIFGEPRMNEVSRRYRKTLWQHRNRKQLS
jgi:hypothetical protein